MKPFGKGKNGTGGEKKGGRAEAARPCSFRGPKVGSYGVGIPASRFARGRWMSPANCGPLRVA